MTAALLIIGRFLIGAYFLQAGARNFMNVPLHTGILTKKGVPMPREALLVALSVQVLGGISVAFSLFPAIGAIGLIGFTIVANALYHDFWNYSGEERLKHRGAVLANVAIVGGFLLVIATA